MKTLLPYVLCVLPVLTGCSSSSLTQKSDYGPVQYGTDSSVVYAKMQKGDNLTPDDVVTLTRAGVRQDVILNYMHAQSTVYVLSDSDVQGLHQAGVAPEVINYMQHSARLFRPTRYPAVDLTNNDNWYFNGPDNPIPNGFPKRTLP